jgi:SWI/SNF-related matrix-associated actin-dependent regulator of chromatin subfamily A3
VLNLTSWQPINSYWLIRGGAPAIKDQAVDRVHRLGQKRKCTVMRLVIEESVEEEVLEVQARKRKLMGPAFGEKEGKSRRGEEQRRRLRDVKHLLR